MPIPKIFVSSTCYDLSMAREQLRTFLLRVGYEPILSEYSDVLFDPRTHTHTSCLQEVPNADMVVLIVGSRFGGKAIPDALSAIDIDSLTNQSFDVEVLENVDKLSITQLEVLKAIESSVPVFAFIDENVWHDHLVYEKNKDLIGKINFPSIDRIETAKYIFEFINFLRHRVKGNGVVSFRRVEDIENHLKRQWASLFQRLLREQREKKFEGRRIFNLSEQIEDLKTAILSSIGNTQTREIARGVIKFRRLIDFILGLRPTDINRFREGGGSFDELLKDLGIVRIVEVPDPRRNFGRSVLIHEDGTFFECRFSPDILADLALDWEKFVALPVESRQVILDALSDERRMGLTLIRHRNENFEDYFKEKEQMEIPLEAVIMEENPKS